MKMPKSIALAFLLTAGSLSATELTEADRQWAQSVKKMFLAGKTSVTTPLEHRAQMAKQIADKLGRHGQIVRTETGFRVELRSSAIARV